MEQIIINLPNIDVETIVYLVTAAIALYISFQEYRHKLNHGVILSAWTSDKIKKRSETKNQKNEISPK